MEGMMKRPRCAALGLGCALAFLAPGCGRAVPTAGPGSPGTDAPLAAPSPPAPPVASSSSSVTPAEAEALLERARDCWDDLGCSLEVFQRLYVQADDARSPDVDCFAFFYGDRVPQDARRARACFERSAANHARRKSPSLQVAVLEPLYLAAMLIDGEGGPRDVERGRRALHLPGVSEAAGSADLEERADEAVRGARSGKPFDPCESGEATQLRIQMCAQLEEARHVSQVDMALKRLSPRLDPAGRASARAAQKAWDSFALAAQLAVGDLYRDGSMRLSQQAWYARELAKQRVEELGWLSAYRPERADASKVERELDRALKAALAGARDAEQRRLMSAAHGAWRASRDADVALGCALAGKTHPASEVARDIRARLARRQIERLGTWSGAGP
jgi:uncharacterized protein YecT (DUF1311 family)